MTGTVEPCLLTLRQAAQYLGVSLFSIRELVRKREVGVVRLSQRNLRLRRADLDMMIQRLTIRPIK